MAARARTIATDIVRTLRREGHVAYFAGGCVRDELLGHEPEDYDVATDATPDQIREVFPRANEVGAAFGVMLIRRHETTIEVATFREETGYSDNRRPDEVRFADAERDAHRRDFTINALFLDPLARDPSPEGLSTVAGSVIDFVGGAADLRNQIVRAVGDPEVRLAEDHLRALRAARFASRFGFDLHKATADAIRKHAAELAGVSRERIGDELRRMLAPGTRGEAVRIVEVLGLDVPALKEPAIATAPPVRLVDAMPVGAGFGLVLAAWAIDRRTARGEDASAGAILSDAATLSGRWRDALCMSNHERDEMAGALQALGRLEAAWASLGVAAKKRVASSRWFPQGMDLLTAREQAQALAIEAEVHELDAIHGGLAPAPLLTGDALVDLGMPPGPAIGSVLDEVYDAQLEGHVTTEGEAAALARRIAGL